MNCQILVCFGTRPEVIKVASTIRELTNRNILFKTVFTGQHRKLYEDVKDLVPPPDFDFAIMQKQQTLTDIFTRISKPFVSLLHKVNPGLVIVQGDTTTAAVVAQLAFYKQVKVGHIEAGLRTYNRYSPFPEEVNRRIISSLAELNWAPTKQAVENLKKEKAANIFLTGNPIVDICRQFNFSISYSPKILVTLHRRESFGEKIKAMIKQVERLAHIHPELEFVFPMHPNPNVLKYRYLLQKTNVIEPLKYRDLLKLLSEVKFVITDSGGIQEECAAFKKKVLVCREYTERPEGIEAGFAKLIGTEIVNNFNWANDNPLWNGENPYGDGKAAQRIVDSIQTHFQS